MQQLVSLHERLHRVDTNVRHTTVRKNILTALSVAVATGENDVHVQCNEVQFSIACHVNVNVQYVYMCFVILYRYWHASISQDRWLENYV